MKAIKFIKIEKQNKLLTICKMIVKKAWNISLIIKSQ